MIHLNLENVLEDIFQFIRFKINNRDHEGVNVSAHATKLVGSALSDPYLIPLELTALQDLYTDWLIKKFFFK